MIEVLRTLSRELASRLQFVAPVIVCAGYVGARYWSFADVFGKRPPLQPDSVDYLHAASLPLTDPLFWTYWKPWGLPLFYKLLPGSTATAAIVQFAIATAAWIALALTVSALIRRPLLKVLGLAAILAFALTPLVAEWDGQLLTESLSNSLTALFIAALLALLQAANRTRLVLVVIAAFAASMVRDTNGYLALLVLVPIGILVARRARARIGLLLASAAILIFALEVWSYDIRRWRPPMQDVIAVRVLPVPAALRYFRARGMPVRPGLGARLVADRVPPSSFDHAAELRYFRPWFDRRARSTYLTYLISHPNVSLAQPLDTIDLVLAPTRPLPYGLDYFRPPRYRDPLPRLVVRALYPQQGWAILGAMVTALAIAAALWREKRAAMTWLAPVCMIAAAVPIAIIVYDGDPMGIGRHSLLVGVTARLSLIILALFFVDAMWTFGFRSRRQVNVPLSL